MLQLSVCFLLVEFDPIGNKINNLTEEINGPCMLVFLQAVDYILL